MVQELQERGLDAFLAQLRPECAFCEFMLDTFALAVGVLLDYLERFRGCGSADHFTPPFPLKIAKAH